MRFNYKARTKEGKVELGTIEASSQEAAASLLQKYNIFITTLEEIKTKQSFFANIELSKRIPKKDLAIFFRQLSIMLESQVPVVGSLRSLGGQIRKKSFKEAIVQIANLVEEGMPLSQAFTTHPKIFDPFYINLIKSGEASGKISAALYHVSDHLEKESDIIAQVRQAMIYPIFVISFLFVVVIIIVLFLLPKIGALIKETGVEPSFFTQLMLDSYRVLGSYWWAFALLILLATLFFVYYFRTMSGRRMYEKVSLRIPLLNDFLKKVFLVRFCSNISTLLLAGVSINKSLAITGETVNNAVYKQLVSEIEQKVSEGEQMSQVLAVHEDYFPRFVTQIVKVGEETGKLDVVLKEVVNFYQKEIKRSIDLFSSLLEPTIIIFLGVVITILAISVLSSLYGVIGAL